MPTRVTDWINEVNTTNFRILMSVILAGTIIPLITIGILFRNWLPSDPQIKVLEGLGLFLLTMMGFDVLQFWAKRSTDADLAAAKNNQVTIMAPTVTPTPPTMVMPTAPAGEVVDLPHKTSERGN